MNIYIVAKSGEKCLRVMKSVEKLGKVAKSGKKWRNVGISDEK